MIPHCCSFVEGKRKLLNGMAIQTTKPRLVTLPFGIPDRVERGIKISEDLFPRGLAPDRIPLHAERSGLEGVGAPTVVKRIEHDFDIVVVVNIFTP